MRDNEKLVLTVTVFNGFATSFLRKVTGTITDGQEHCLNNVAIKRLKLAFLQILMVNSQCFNPVSSGELVIFL
jgi:hypothetical protein